MDFGSSTLQLCVSQLHSQFHCKEESLEFRVVKVSDWTTCRAGSNDFDRLESRVQRGNYVRKNTGEEKQRASGKINQHTTNILEHESFVRPLARHAMKFSFSTVCLLEFLTAASSSRDQLELFCDHLKLLKFNWRNMCSTWIQFESSNNEGLHVDKFIIWK